MEYVVVSTSSPTYLTLHLPKEIAGWLHLAPEKGAVGPAARSLSFLRRGVGIVRVVATHTLREALLYESYRGRLVATARVSLPLEFNLPAELARFLGLGLELRSRGTRGTDDTLLWFVRADEYYAARGAGAEQEDDAEAGRPPSEGGVPAVPAHVYLTKSLIPLPRDLAQLAEVEDRIERQEWRAGSEAIQGVLRPRRGSSHGPG